MDHEEAAHGRIQLHRVAGLALLYEIVSVMYQHMASMHTKRISLLSMLSHI